jgi:calcium-dependent protein kinase
MISSMKELTINPSIFVQENLNDFFYVYNLTDQVLGRGPYSEARVCEHKRTNVRRAVKIILRKGIYGETASCELLQEVQILKELDHPNIVRIFEFFEDSKHYYIVEELCTGEDLFEMISKRERLTETQAACIMQQVFSAVAYLHARQVVHRDIKPENIIVFAGSDDTPHCKLIDFDTATFCTIKRQLRGSIGTAYYMAPEVLTQHYNEKCDMWSCGVLLYIMLSGTPPFPGVTDKEILKNVSKARYTFDQADWSNISSDAKSLISQLLLRDPAIRLSAQQAYNHHWIASRAVASSDNTKSILSGTLSRIRNFHSSNKLKEAMHTFIISQIIAYEDLKELSDSFSAIDVNGDGYIEHDELMRVFLNNMSPVEATAEVNRIFSEIDTDNSGYIDYSEFLRATIDHKLILSQKNLKRAFDLFDKDGNGLITTTELRQLFENTDCMDDEIWVDLIQEVDQNKGGEIDLFEFEALLKTRIETPRHSFVMRQSIDD